MKRIPGTIGAILIATTLAGIGFTPIVVNAMSGPDTHRSVSMIAPVVAPIVAPAALTVAAPPAPAPVPEPPVVRIVASRGLWAHSGPSIASPNVRVVAPAETITLICQARTTSSEYVIMDGLADGTFVSDLYVSTPAHNAFSPGYKPCEPVAAPKVVPSVRKAAPPVTRRPSQAAAAHTTSSYAAHTTSSAPVTSGGLLGRISHCESSGNPLASNGSHFGLYQFDLGTWRSVGGTGDPRNASPAEQTMRAQLLMNSRGTQPWLASQHCWA